MRFKGHTDVISIRVLRDEDIALVHKSFYQAVKTGQLEELPVLPTEKFRYTLPIVLIGEHKVALPSMGIMLTDLKNTPFKNFKYECKFRPPQ